MSDGIHIPKQTHSSYYTETFSLKRSVFINTYIKYKTSQFHKLKWDMMKTD